MKICFFGVGGVGGYYASILTHYFSESHEFYFIARGSHKEAISTNGLTLKKSGGNEIINVHPKLCTETVTDIPQCDLVILSVKSYDLEDAIKDVSKIVSDTSVVLPLLNGVDIYDRIRKQMHKGIVLPSCVYVGTHIESPGVIYQKGGNGKILTGKDPIYPDFYPENILSLGNAAGIQIKWEDNVNSAIWTKFMFIAAYGLVAAVYERSLGQILEHADQSECVVAIMHEIEAIARKMNIPLSPNVVEESFLKAKQFPYEAKTSFQRDVESKGRINEGDLFGGAIVRYGIALNIPTPVTEKTYNQLLKKFEWEPEF